jgi:hypothetical protein
MKVEIVEPAQIPLTPAYPNKKSMYGGGLVVAILAPIGLLFALERFGAVLRTTEEAEREFGIKVVGIVPRIEGWKRPGNFFQSSWPFFALTLILLVTIALLMLKPSLQPPSGVASLPRVDAAC